MLSICMRFLLVIACLLVAAQSSTAPQTFQPTLEPTAEPTAEPSAEPTSLPMAIPSAIPSAKPTINPSVIPTTRPSRPPTSKPMLVPTAVPSCVPTALPTTGPSPDDPTLLSYKLDCGIGKLVLSFDTAISAKTVNLDGLRLQAAPALATSGVNSSVFQIASSFNDLSKQGNTTELTIYMSADDIARLNLASPIGRRGTTYLTLRRDTIFSPTGKSAAEVSRSHAMSPATFVADIFPPYLLSFSLVMDTGLMTIDFSEPLDVSTFTLDGLTIQCCAYLGDATNDPAEELLTYNLHPRDSSLVSASNLNRRLVYQLGSYNLNQIKARVGLASSQDTTYLSAWKPFVQDTSGNNVSMVWFDSLHALKVTHFLPDTVAPTLLYWDFNLNAGQVSLTFSETVYTMFFNYSKVLFTNSPVAGSTAATTLRVDKPINSTQWNSDVIVFTLNDVQFNLLKASSNLMSEKANSYLILEYNTVVDTVVPIPNQRVTFQNVYQGTDATPANPRLVRAFYADVTRPRLVSFTLDMDAHRVVLVFSETVRLASVRVDQITLQAEANIGVGTEYLVLGTSYATVASTVDSPVVVLSLSMSAFAFLKDGKQIAKSAESSFVSLTVKFVTDRSGNSTHGPNQVEEVPPGYARMAARYIPDRSAPYLLSWHLDLTQNVVVLAFSKPVDSRTMQVQQLMLSSDPVVLPSTASLTLSEGSFVSLDELNVVTVQMSVSDARRLRMLGASNLCVSLTTCYLTLPRGFVNDSSSTSSTGEIVHTELLPVTRIEGDSFVVDTVPPMLLNYTVELNTRVLSLFFDEVVNLRSINTSALDFTYLGNKTFDSVRMSQYGYPLTDALNTKFDLQLTVQDVIRLQRKPPLATSLSTVNLTVGAGFVTDLAGNQVALPTRAATGDFPPFMFVEDSTPPTLVGVHLVSDTDTKNITLYFNEVVVVESIVQSSLLFASSSGATVPMTKAKLLTTANTSRAISYSLVPLASELAAAVLTTTQSNTHVFVGATGAVRDASPARNRIAAMTITDAVRDGVSIVSWRLDMSAGTILLELSYPSQINAVDATKFTLYSADLSLSYVLTGLVSFTVDEGGPVVFIKLNALDYQVIRSTFTIAGADSIVLLAGLTSLIDDRGMQLSAAATLTCAHFFNDISPLTVTSYALDLSVGTLRLYFSKEADTSTVDLESIVTLSEPLASLSLTNLSIINEPNIFGYVSPNVTTLLLSLNNNAPLTTREQILLLYPLASRFDHTFLSIEKGFVYDLARPRNPLQAILASAQKQPSALVLDGLAPTFLTFDLDLSLRLMTLYFSEAINMSSVKVTGIQFLQNRLVSTSTKYTLSARSTVISVEPNRAVDIQLSQFDIDTIVLLSPNLLTTADNTNIAMAPGTVSDLATPANPVPETLFRYGVPVQTFIPDTVKPQLLWYNISMQTGDLVLYFTERVVCATIKPHNIILQSDAFVGRKSTVFRLGNATAVNCQYGPVYDQSVYVTFDPEELITLKAMPDFTKTRNTTFLRILSGFGKDIFGNPTEEIKDGFALAPSQYIGDTSPPELLGFLVNQQQQLSLAFSEPVDARTLDWKEIWAQSAHTNPYRSYPFVQAKIFRGDATRTKLDFEVYYDLEFMWRGEENVMKTQNATYLRATSAAIMDFSGNALLARPRANAVQVGPAVVSWDLDMNSGILQLTFNEPVRPAFSLVGFRIQDKYDDDSNHLAFTTTTNMTASSGATVFVALSAGDMNALKRSGLVGEPLGSVFNLVTGTGSMVGLYITAEFGLTRSLNGGDLQPYLPTVQVRTTNAVRVKRLSKDTTPPKCLSFNIDLNAGTLTLNFDEPVSANSLVLTGLVVRSLTSGRFVPLTNTNRDVQLVGETHLVITLNPTDLNAIKRAITTTNGVQYLDSLVMNAGAVTDIRGNAFIGNDADHPIPVDTFTPDTSPPVLQSWTLDLSMHALSLKFNEFVSYTSIRPTSLVLLSTSNFSSAPQRLRLTNYSKVYQGDVALNELLVDLELYRRDAFALEAMVPLGLATNISNAFLAIGNLSDIFGNRQTTTQVVRAASVTADTVKPRFEAFDFHYTSGDTNVLITAYFSKVIKISTFTCHDFDMRTSPEKFPLDVVDFSSTTCTLVSGQDNSHIVQFYVPHALFGGTSIGNSAGVTWMGVPVRSGGVLYTQDLAGNTIIAQRSDRYLRVGPQLLRFHMNVERGLVVYDFNKPLDYSVPFLASVFGYFSTVTRTYYYLQSTSTGGSVVLEQLEEFASTPTADSTIGSLFLDQTDLYSTKMMDIGAATFFGVLAATTTLSDHDGYLLNERSIGWQRLLVSDIIMDTEAPQINSLSIDLSIETIVMVFDEPIRLSTLVMPNFCLQNAADIAQSNGSYCLTDSVPTMNVATLTLTLSLTDSAALKLSPSLATSLSHTFLSFVPYTAEDMAGNQLPAISTTAARQFDVLVVDTVDPTLDAFKFDLTATEGTLLTLIFSEPVKTDMMNLTALTIQSRFASRDGVKYRITGGSVLSSEYNVVTVLLLASDVTAMKLIPGLIRSKQSTYLVVDPDFTTDLAGNVLKPYLDGGALSCLEYVRDNSPPVIVQSIYDSNNGKITFIFNEPVVLSDVDVTALTVQLPVSLGGSLLISFGNTQARYTLSSMSSVSNSALLSNVLEIVLSQTDQNELKQRFPLVSAKEYTYFSYTPLFVQDTSSNAIKQVKSTAPVQVTDYLVDTTRPTIATYELNMNQQLVTLTFSEAIQATSVDLSQLTMQTIETKRFGFSAVLNESTFTVGTGALSNTLKISIGDDKFSYMKSVGIGSDQFHSFLSWTDTFVADNSGNYLRPLWDASVLGSTPRAPDTLTLDTTPPALQRWYLDREATSITAYLYFNEPVLLINVTHISVYRNPKTASGKPASFGSAPMTLYANTSRSVNSTAAVVPWDLTYSEYNRRVSFKLLNYCTDKYGGSWCLTNNLPSENLFAFLNQTSSSQYGYFLTLGVSVVQDFALIPNAAQVIDERNQVLEGGPDCSTCSAGQFTSRNCTATSDRQCRSCSSCLSGQYVAESCTPYHDISCAVCSNCGFGNYIAAACSATANTQCEPCSICPPLHYAARSCERGRDVLCNPCTYCEFPDAEIRAACEADKLYRPWQEANCCVGPKGKKVECKDVDRAQLLQTAIDGRHHWTFPGSTSPRIDTKRIPNIQFPRAY